MISSTIFSIITFIFSVLGAYGFFVDNMFLIYIGFSMVIIEIIFEAITGQNLFTVWLALLISIGLIFGGVNWFKAITICLCFENILCFLTGTILLISIKFLSQTNKMVNIENTDNSKDNYSKEEIIEYLKNYLDLPEEICYNIYYASDLFKKEKRVEAIKIIEDKLLPQLKKIKDLDKIEKIFDLLEGNLGLNEKDTHYYITKLFNNN